MTWHIAVPAFGLACGVAALALAAFRRRVNWIGLVASAVNGSVLVFWLFQ